MALQFSLAYCHVQRYKAGMEAKHPLVQYSEAHGKPIADIAKDAKCSRMTLYRLMSGKQNATIDLLERVSAATGGVVRPADFFAPARSPEKGAA